MARQLDLTAALKTMGNAAILVNLDGIAGGDAWRHLGAMEGDRSFAVSFSENPLTAPEQTGEGVAHQMYMNVNEANITAGVIGGDPDLFALVNPFGIKGGGFSSFRKPREVAAVIIPQDEIGFGLSNTLGTTAGWTREDASPDGTAQVVGSAAAPQNAIWLPRAIITHEAVPFRFQDGGKSIVNVTIRGMFYGPAGDGFKVYAQGDPNRAEVGYGVTMQVENG